MEVILYGLFADEEFFAYLLVAVSLCDKLDNFFFAVAQQWLWLRRGPPSDDFENAFMTSAVM